VMRLEQIAPVAQVQERHSGGGAPG
jgi:hypothetical protein